MEKKSWLQIGMIYACSVIGVGFASGNEIVNFFTSYDTNGFFGILIASFIFSLQGLVIVNVACKYNTYKISNCYFLVCGKKLSKIFEFIGVFYSFCLFNLMITAWTSILDDIKFISDIFKYLIFVFLFIIYCIYDFNNKSVASMIRIVMLSGIGIVLLVIIYGHSINVFSSDDIVSFNKWYLSALMYIGYNSFLSSKIICEAGKKAKTVESAKIGSFVGGGFLLIISFLLNLIFILWYKGDHNFPILYMLDNYDLTVHIFFLIILSICILYSGFNAGLFTVEEITQRFKIKKIHSVLIIVLASSAVIPLKFNILISFIYPIFGILGLSITVLFLLTYFIKEYFI